jgi:hypothetical protein
MFLRVAAPFPRDESHVPPKVTLWLYPYGSILHVGKIIRITQMRDLDERFCTRPQYRTSKLVSSAKNRHRKRDVKVPLRALRAIRVEANMPWNPPGRSTELRPKRSARPSATDQPDARGRAAAATRVLPHRESEHIICGDSTCSLTRTYTERSDRLPSCTPRHCRPSPSAQSSNNPTPISPSPGITIGLLCTA